MFTPVPCVMSFSMDHISEYSSVIISKHFHAHTLNVLNYVFYCLMMVIRPKHVPFID